MGERWGVWSNWSKRWCFGISEPTRDQAKRALFRKIGKDAYKWRFEYKRIKPQKQKIGGRDNMTTGQETNVTTGEVRLSYVNLFTPRANQPGQEPKYSVTILIPKSDVATKQRIDAAIANAINKGVQTVWAGARPPQPKIPIYDGDGLRPNGETFGPECKGHWVLTASSKQQQQVVDANLNPIINQTEVYSGMYGRVNINFFPYNNSGNRGIGAGLGPVQKLRDGEPLGGRVSAEQAFGSAPVQPQPNYGAPPQPQAYGQQPQQGGWQMQTPQGWSNATPSQVYGQPAPPQFGQAPQAAPQIDPITGKPLSGGIMGL